MDDKMKTDEELRTENPELYRIAREKGTEAPFTGKYYSEKSAGMYRCGVCGNELFSSDAKFDSGTGWPSFTSPKSGDAIKTAPDTGIGMERTEVICNKCGAHLGHVFDDGPGANGKRFCINSISLDLKKEE